MDEQEMKLRDEYALVAFKELLQRYALDDVTHGWLAEEVWAYADAMVLARKGERDAE